MRLRATRLTAIAGAVRRKLPVFSPSELFATGAPGLWYDFADFSGLFQDAAGTIPVTAVEQPVGLVLDKSKGLVLGPELVVNGDFSQGTTGWSGFTTNPPANSTISNPGGYLRVTKTGSVAGWCQQAYTNFVIGKWYIATVNFLTSNSSLFISNTSNSVSVGPGTTGYKTSAGQYTVTFSATATTLYICLGTTAATADFDNISVREISGNHAFQVTSASRPILSARKNLLVGTAALATQTVYTKAVSYVLSFWGAGTVTLSGTASGALVGTGAENRVSLTFTPTEGTLTLTVAGSVLKAQLEMINETV